MGRPGIRDGALPPWEVVQQQADRSERSSRAQEQERTHGSGRETGGETGEPAGAPAPEYVVPSSPERALPPTRPRVHTPTHLQHAPRAVAAVACSMQLQHVACVLQQQPCCYMLQQRLASYITAIENAITNDPCPVRFC